MAHSDHASDPVPALLVLLLAILACICIGSLAFAGQGNEEPFAHHDVGRGRIDAVRVLSVIDGDTFKAEASLWPGLAVTALIRVEGVDTPERRSRCAEERRLAMRAHDALAFLLEGPIALHDVRRDKFGGRFIASVSLADGSDLGETLIAAGYARPYSGGKRASWC
jgi:micrococcal nuclease